MSAPTASAPPAAPSTPPTYTEEPILSIDHWNPGLVSIRLRRNPAYKFVPGQFARIGLRHESGEIIWRAYSIVSAPAEPFIEFFLVVLPTGEFSSRLGKLVVGDAILVDPTAQGFLTPDRFTDGKDLWLFATGTGLAPYISMLRDPPTRARFERIVLVVSVRKAEDFAYLAELAALDNAAGAKLIVIKTLTRDEGSTDALHGRVTHLTESGELERAAGFAMDKTRSRFMLCGNPEMVESMRAILKARGFTMNRKLTPGNIIVENYW